MQLFSLLLLLLLSVLVGADDVPQLRFTQCKTSNQQNIVGANWIQNFDNQFSSILTYKFTQGATQALNYADSIRIVVPLASDTDKALFDRSYNICPNKEKCARDILQRRELVGQLNVEIPFDQSAKATKIYLMNKAENRVIFVLCVISETTQTSKKTIYEKDPNSLYG